mmetsp:Transcript_10408/g.20806  ORF Transcript_10408/g.20806 Transcript_10408/m.20806 type:complete len:92 (-) Transcript_10408:796-1071(-)
MADAGFAGAYGAFFEELGGEIPLVPADPVGHARYAAANDAPTLAPDARARPPAQPVTPYIYALPTPPQHLPRCAAVDLRLAPLRAGGCDAP